MVAGNSAAGNLVADMVQGDYLAVDNSHVAGHSRSLAEEAGPEAPRYNSWQLVHSYLRMKLREGERAKRRKEKEKRERGSKDTGFDTGDDMSQTTERKSRSMNLKINQP